MKTPCKCGQRWGAEAVLAASSQTSVGLSALIAIRRAHLQPASRDKIRLRSVRSP